jgi:hypothetical protein
MKTALRFIDITRRNRGVEDGSSLLLGGRITKPGFACVVGNLEHCAEIAPRTEAARLALIAWLESDECKAVARRAGGEGGK